MRTQKKFLPFLYAFLLSLIPIIIAFIFMNPDTKLSLLGFDTRTTLIMLFFIFISIFLISTFIFASVRRGLLSSIFITGVLALRVLGLKGYFHLSILLVIILLVEYLYARRTS